MGNGASASAVATRLSEQDIKDLLKVKSVFNKAKFDALKGEDGRIAKEQFFSQLEGVYESFGPNGTMSSAKYVKMLKDSKIIDKKTFTANQAELIFARIIARYSQNPKIMMYAVFRDYGITELATAKATTEADIVATLVLCDGPILTATKGQSRFHDDKSTYTGQYVHGGPDVRVQSNDLSNLLDRSDANVRGVKKADITEEEGAQRIQMIARGRNARKEMARIDSAPVLDPVAVSAMLGPEGSANLREAFLRFAPSGEMDGRTFTRMMVDSNLTGKKFKATDADLVFAKCKKAAGGATVLRINFTIFESVALEPIAEKLKISIVDVADALSMSGGPINRGTVADNVRLHDDKSTFTGAYAKGGPDVSVKTNAFVDSVTR